MNRLEDTTQYCVRCKIKVNPAKTGYFDNFNLLHKSKPDCSKYQFGYLCFRCEDKHLEENEKGNKNG